MRKTLLLSLLGATIAMPMSAEQIQLNGKTHEIKELISRQVGPGITYKRLRSDTYPLNINMIMVDATNPYNKLQTTTANESAAGTEALVKQAARTSGPQMRAVAGANGNFWCVASQEPNYPLLNGSCFGGHGKNGKMITETNNWSCQWNHGWKHTGIIGVDANKVLHVGRHYYMGYIKHPSYGNSPAVIQQINKMVPPGEFAMYNSFYGTNKEFRPVKLDTNPATGKTEWMVTRDNDCTEILLNFAPGEDWHIGQPMRVVVKEVRRNAGNGTLGNYDLALVGKGDAGQILSIINVGDEFTIETNYYDINNQPIQLENFICGNATVMVDGELTEFNTSENYNSQVYSRTGYGASADRKTLYIIVIDKSNDPTWGNSAGCPTRVMCEIAKHYGCTDMVNFDAGGSAMMYLDGAIINRTTEASPRAVSNGFLCYSTAPEDKKVASLAFDDVTLVAPPYSTFTPKVIAYNQYGDVIDYDFHGFTLSCAPELGSCDGETFIAGGTPMTGTLTASYGGVSVSKDLTIENAEMSIRVKDLLIDTYREYPLEVTATIGSNVYVYDPASIAWSTDRDGVVSITNGVLKGLQSGSCVVTGRIGDFEDTMNVTVEVADDSFMALTDFTGWKITNVGVTGSTMAEDGTVTYNYGINARTGASLQLAKAVPFYSLPDNIWITFRSSIPVDRVTADIRVPGAGRANNVDAQAPEGGFAADMEHRVDIPMAEICDHADIASFPLTFNSVKFTFPKDETLKGQSQTLRLINVEGEYLHHSTVGCVAVNSDHVNASIFPNPALAGSSITIKANGDIRSIDIYNLTGARMLKAMTTGAVATIPTSNLAPGMYIARVTTSAGAKSLRFVVR